MSFWIQSGRIILLRFFIAWGGSSLVVVRSRDRGQQAPQRENPRSSRLDFLEIFFLKTLSLDSAARAKNFFVFGCGWWYDREIVLLPPLCEYRERDYERDYQATLPQGRTAADGCKPRHGRDDRKRERSFSGLSRLWMDIEQGRLSLCSM